MLKGVHVPDAANINHLVTRSIVIREGVSAQTTFIEVTRSFDMYLPARSLHKYQIPERCDFGYFSWALSITDTALAWHLLAGFLMMAHEFCIKHFFIATHPWQILYRFQKTANYCRLHFFVVAGWMVSKSAVIHLFSLDWRTISETRKTPVQIEPLSPRLFCYDTQHNSRMLLHPLQFNQDGEERQLSSSEESTNWAAHRKGRHELYIMDCVIELCMDPHAFPAPKH